MVLRDESDFASFDVFVFGCRKSFRGCWPGFAKRFEGVGGELSKRIGTRGRFGVGLPDFDLFLNFRRFDPLYVL